MGGVGAMCEEGVGGGRGGRQGWSFSGERSCETRGKGGGDWIVKKLEKD